MNQNRLQSKVVWVSILAQVLVVLALFVPNNIAEEVKIVGTAVIEMLTLFGILNNPTDSQGF